MNVPVLVRVWSRQVSLMSVTLTLTSGLAVLVFDGVSGVDWTVSVGVLLLLLF